MPNVIVLSLIIKSEHYDGATIYLLTPHQRGGSEPTVTCPDYVH